MSVEEEQYNQEAAELLSTIRCPICNAQPKVIEGVAILRDDGTVLEGAVVTCYGYEEHTYMINQEEYDGQT